MTDRTTITLSRDVPRGGDIEAAEAELLGSLRFILGEFQSSGQPVIIQEPTLHKANPGGGYVPLLGPGGLIATIVEARAVIEE